MNHSGWNTTAHGDHVPRSSRLRTAAFLVAIARTGGRAAVAPPDCDDPPSRNTRTEPWRQRVRCLATHTGAYTADVSGSIALSIALTRSIAAGRQLNARSERLAGWVDDGR